MPIRSVPNDPDRRQSWTGRLVLRRLKWPKGRYADDPEYRERKRAQSRVSRAWQRRADPDYYRDKQRARRYRISVLEIRAILAAQDRACAICKRSDRKLLLDHCHATGKVRRFLCTGCNIAIGCFHDDPNLTDAATAYLKLFA
jgi:hypothetical protein